MDNNASDLSTVIISGGSSYQRELLAGMCCIKKATFKVTEAANQPITIKYQSFEVHGLYPAIHYLENKFIVPELIRGTPEAKAAICMLVNRIESRSADLEEIIQFGKDKKQYLLGAAPTLPDIALIPILHKLPDCRYRSNLEHLKCSNSS